ncbi:Rhs repeat-associated core [Acidimicrobiia bacterium]
MASISTSPRIRPLLLGIAAVGVSIAMLASSCTSSDDSRSRSAGAAAGNPIDLPALPSGSGSGERVPLWFGATVAPDTWVSSSLSPTLVVPGATGAWDFTVTDLSGGTSTFGSKQFKENGASARIPLGTLNDRQAYTWTATSAGQQSVAGTFSVDTQLSDVQDVDTVGGVATSLSSGEASFSWSSHAMQSLGGSVGIGLQFQGSNPVDSGVPAGWKLLSSSGSGYVSVVTREDGSIGLVSKNGQVSNYREGAGGSWDAVKLSGDSLDTSGLAPVIIANPDKSWSVTTKGSTSTFVDDNGDGTANLSGVSSDGKPMLQQNWDGGLLRSITDPVSGRSLDLVYGGGSCPKAAPGFVAAPKGMLCQVKFWDASTSSISYVALADGSVSIGRMADFPEAGADGAVVFDVAYDAAGRIARTRSPLVAVAAASNLIPSDDSAYWSEILYTPEGRVLTATEPAPSVGGTRCTRTYRNEGSQTTVNDGCLGRDLGTVTFDSTTFFALRESNVLGQERVSTWNFASGELLSVSDFTGLVTANRFVNGLLVETRGPARETGAAQSTLRQYDESYTDSAEGIAMRGLDVTYWPSATERGDNAIQELGPIMGGTLAPSLTLNWDSSPAGNNAGWSALMTGALTIGQAGSYRFESGNTNAKLRVANIACENGGCDAVSLPAGPVSIRVDVSSAESRSSIDLTWAGPDTGGGSQSIPTDRLGPQYGYATEMNVVDPNAVRSGVENISRSSYSNPATGLLTSRVNGAGSVSKVTYESAGWNRALASTLPAGNVLQSTWWGDKEAAAAPCAGAKKVVQAGASKNSITPGPDGADGPSAQQWYTASGRIAATAMSGGATQCMTYDSAGRILSTETLNMGRVTKSVYDYAVGGNPLMSSVTATLGSEVTTISVEVDLAGRTVQTIDPFGVIISKTYDTRTGLTASTTTTAPGSAPSVTTNTYDKFGQLESLAIDGRTMATVNYDGLGLPATVTNGNGVTSTFGYDNSDRLISAVRKAGNGGNFTSSRVLSAGGSTSQATVAANGRTSTFDYTHDASSRLSAVSVSAGLVPEQKSWEYTYDANSNRSTQKQSVNGVASSSYTYSYDSADRLTKTNDPTASDAIVYDSRGNATTLGSNTFTYDASNLLVEVSDGTITIGYDRDVNGSIFSKRTTVAGATTTVFYAAGGVILDEEKRPVAQIMTLPGGVLFTRSVTPAVPNRWDYTTISGDRFFSTDDAGSLTGDVSVFDPFGQLLTAPTPANPALPDLSWQAATGNETAALKVAIVVMGSRVYVPALGRFIQLDPVAGGSANGYDYANQSPLAMSDPSGEAAGDPGWSNWLGMGLVAIAGVAGSLLTPASWGPKAAMMIGSLVGLMAGVANVGVQLATGTASVVDIGTLFVGLLAGVAGGSIIGKIRWARYQKSLPENMDLVDFVLNEAKFSKSAGITGRGGSGGGYTSSNLATVRTTERATVRPPSGAQAPVQPGAAAIGRAPSVSPVAAPVRSRPPTYRPASRNSGEMDPVMMKFVMRLLEK